jgi:hypothetical protein
MYISRFRLLKVFFLKKIGLGTYTTYNIKIHKGKRYTFTGNFKIFLIYPVFFIAESTSAVPHHEEQQRRSMEILDGRQSGRGTFSSSAPSASTSTQPLDLLGL